VVAGFVRLLAVSDEEPQESFFVFFICGHKKTCRSAGSKKLTQKLTLTRFELRILFVNHINATFTTNDFAVQIANFFRF
jgi:hypothetical protein